MKIIGFAGLKGSGKTTCAKFFCCAGKDSGAFTGMVGSLADPIKDGLLAMLGPIGVTEEQVRGPSEMREASMGPGLPTVRRALQTLGTDWGRKMIHPDIWIRVLIAQAKAVFEHAPGTILVIDDVRFENEMVAVKRAGGLIVHVDRPSMQITDDLHASERDCNPHSVAWDVPEDCPVIRHRNVHLVNSGSLEDLQGQIQFLAPRIGFDPEVKHGN